VLLAHLELPLPLPLVQVLSPRGPRQRISRHRVAGRMRRAGAAGRRLDEAALAKIEYTPAISGPVPPGVGCGAAVSRYCVGVRVDLWWYCQTACKSMDRHLIDTYIHIYSTQRSIRMAAERERSAAGSKQARHAARSTQLLKMADGRSAAEELLAPSTIPQGAVPGATAHEPTFLVRKQFTPPSPFRSQRRRRRDVLFVAAPILPRALNAVAQSSVP
jgi:hypothetical protein